MKKILLVDDDSAVVETVKFLLEAEGYEVITAGDGKEGFEIAQKEKPDVILLDILMPKVNGYQMAIALHNEKELKDIPVILLTATAQVAGSVKIQTPAKFKISKPFSADTLLKTIEKALAKTNR